MILFAVSIRQVKCLVVCRALVIRLQTIRHTGDFCVSTTFCFFLFFNSSSLSSLNVWISIFFLCRKLCSVYKTLFFVIVHFIIIFGMNVCCKHNWVQCFRILIVNCFQTQILSFIWMRIEIFNTTNECNILQFKRDKQKVCAFCEKCSIFDGNLHMGV